jgi:hypothetical protein
MKQEHAEMLAAGLADIDYKPSFQERQFYASRDKAPARDKSVMRTPGQGRSLMVPHLLRSGIFALSDKTAASVRAIPKYDDISNHRDGASVEYKGARLRQRDLRALLGLMHAVGGMPCEAAKVTFHADDFLALIGKRPSGKKPSTETVAALRDSLAALRSATFIVRRFGKDRGVVFGFVDSVEWDKRRFTVHMSPRAHQAVDALGFSLVSITARNKLTDGIQTAMADVIASTSGTRFDLDALAALFGREPVQFGRELRGHMDALVEASVVKAWSHTRGCVHVERFVSP